MIIQRLNVNPNTFIEKIKSIDYLLIVIILIISSYKYIIRILLY